MLKSEEEDPAALLALRREVEQYHAWLRELRRKGLWDPKTQFAPDPSQMHTLNWE
jgi:hypothetical protein